MLTVLRSGRSVLSIVVAILFHCLFALWLLALNSGQRVGVYLSDISAAFDRVDINLLLQKCRRAGVGDAFCDLLHDVFAPRKAEILVGGKKSTQRLIANQVFQGTVLGPPMLSSWQWCS